MNKGSVLQNSGGRRHSWGAWLKDNAHALLLVAALIGGWIANFATLAIRLNDVEKSEGKLEQRFERDVVPRQEQEVRDRMLDQRLEQMQRSLDAIQQELRQSRGTF
jgi:ribosomal protein S2